MSAKGARMTTNKPEITDQSIFAVLFFQSLVCNKWRIEILPGNMPLARAVVRCERDGLRIQGTGDTLVDALNDAKRQVEADLVKTQATLALLKGSVGA